MGGKPGALIEFCVKYLRRFLAVAYYLVFFVCAVEVGSAAGDLDHAPGNVVFLFGAGLVFLAWGFIILVHELGHAIAAWVQGWHVPVIAVRGLTVWPGRRRLRYGASAFPGYNGGVLVIPAGSGDQRRQLAFIFLGGSAANFLLSVAAALCVVGWQDKGFLSQYCTVIAFLSALTGVLNLIPRIWGSENDGAAIIQTLRSTTVAPRIHQFLIWDEIAEGRRPKDWNANLVLQLKNDIATEQDEGHAGLLLFSRYFDERDLSSASAVLDWAEQKLGSSDNGVLIFRALLLAYADGNGSAAADILSRIRGKKVRSTPEYRIVQAVAAWASGDVAGRETATHQAKLALKRAPFASVSDYELLEEIQTPRVVDATSCIEIMAN